MKPRGGKLNQSSGPPLDAEGLQNTVRFMLPWRMQIGRRTYRHRRSHVGVTLGRDSAEGMKQKAGFYELVFAVICIAC